MPATNLGEKGKAARNLELGAGETLLSTKKEAADWRILGLCSFGMLLSAEVEINGFLYHFVTSDSGDQLTM